MGKRDVKAFPSGSHTKLSHT